MSYFSRLTEIITCNLSEILSTETDPCGALPRIIAEMEEGLQGAMRSVNSAAASAERYEKEIADHRVQIEQLTAEARRALGEGREDEARQALLVKREIEDVVAGLKLQHQAAVNTRDHLTTTLRAVECRLNEARRKFAEFSRTGASAASSVQGAEYSCCTLVGVGSVREREVDHELEALKRELGQTH